ncbi:M1 family metallopeptidase [Aggregatimonas sangjinii]|uniref:Aminopeptidase N n=1 Tax=Aggregatimonas sangjinii TaxID=2583587 RepID=A0A5B7SSS7_9FLAO|nr:M1 family metallopeptidase [Aggregatimonas sangjinii]QCX00031.1 M1 family metallopeptidase [Aggregatimonas sangjinii]
MKHLLIFILICIPFQGTAQHQEKVDFILGKAMIFPSTEEKSIEGHVEYIFEVRKNVDSIFLDAKNMKFSSVTLNKHNAEYHYDEKKIVIYDSFIKGSSHTLRLEFACTPKQTVYFSGWDDTIAGNEQIWTQGQGKYTSYWLPSFDNMQEKVEFDLSISVANELKVIANGRLVNEESIENVKIWEYDMQKPMSSYLLAFVIGNYDKDVLTSSSGITIQNYYYPEDSLKVEPTYRYTKRIFDVLEKEIGVSYPWQNYKQIPVHDFLYAGMENTGATIFADGYVIDSTAFIDKNYVNVNAHEMAHQWFGNLVTEKDGNHHWLHEGFATYYAYLAEKELFGIDHYLWKLYRSFKELESLQARGEGQHLLDPKASSLIFYEKGALALHMLRAEIGDKAFRKGIKRYLEKFQFKNVTVSDFLEEMEKAGRTDLSDYRKKWLESTTMPSTEVKSEFAKNSRSLKSLFDMEADLKEAQSDAIDYSRYWNETNSIHLKKYILANYSRNLPQEIIEKAFAADSLPVRQELAKFDDIKSLSKADYETLLNDKSYITVENALIQLWSTYPEYRSSYLDVTKDIIGLPDKNVRLLWLTLATLTEGYNGRMTKQYFDELSAYTSPRYSFEIRQTAFQYLKEVFGFTEQNLLDLIQATNHHAWQFKKFARALLDDLLEDEVYKERITALVPELKPEELRYIQTKLK